MAKTKATKKFEKNKLKDTLKRRKEVAKIKQRHQLKEKKKAKRADENGGIGNDDNATTKRKTATDATKHSLENMNVDEFFAGGFELPQNANKNKRRSGKRKRPDSDDESQEGDNSSVASVEEHASLAGSDDNERGLGDDEDIGDHEEDLKKLQLKDPEFYKYLKENDAELLEFAEDSNFLEIDDLSEDEDKDTVTPGKTKDKKKDQGGKTVTSGDSGDVTSTMVKKWNTNMIEQHSLRSMREILLAFRAAANLNEEDQGKYKYTVSDADVYHEVLSCALQQIPLVLNHHIPVKELPGGKVRVPTDSKKYSTLAPLIKSHLTSVQKLLGSLSDTGSLKLTLTSLNDLLPYGLSFKKLIRDLSRTISTIWSSSNHSEATRISAFLVLRRMLTVGDLGIKEAVLRSAYSGLVQGCRTTTVHNLAGINLIKNTAVELWGLADANIAYGTAFTFIRQLAIHLRSSIKNNSNDAYKKVYNWQYVHSLDFWSRTLSTHCNTLTEASRGQKESPLRPLIYPLTQATLGAMRLIPTAAYFPLRFQLIRSLLRLSQSTNTYIPLAVPLYEVLTSAEMKKPPKPATIAPLNFETSIRAAKSYLRTRVYQDGVGELVMELLSEFFGIWAKNIAFPELVLPVVVMLKRWLKEVSPFNNHQANGKAPSSQGKRGKKGRTDDYGGNRNAKVNNSISLLIQKLNVHSQWISDCRAKVEFAPNNRAGVEGFLKDIEWNKTPFGAFVEGQRKLREERMRILEQSRRAEEERRKRDEQKDRQRDNEMNDFDDRSDDEEEGGSEVDEENIDLSDDGEEAIFVDEDEEDEDEDEDEMEFEDD